MVVLVNRIEFKTNRITKRAKREREPSRAPVKIFMKAQKKIKNHKKLEAFVKSHFSVTQTIGRMHFLTDSYASIRLYCI